MISKNCTYRYPPPRVSVTEFKDLTDIKVPQHSDLKLLPPTAGSVETSLRTQIKKSIRPILRIFPDFLVLSNGFGDSLQWLE